MSGETNSSTQCSNIAQEASRKCWRLRCSWQSRKKKSLVPTGGLQENEHREENWENLLGPQAKCQITSWKARGHGNWPWKKRVREDRRYSTGSPKETVAVGDPESQCPGAEEAEAWPKGPFGSADCADSKGQNSQRNKWQQLLMETLTLLSSTIRSSRLG